ncbi:uncharacterized protein, partial [Notothenia coriiceps]|uniref:Myb/SANT-like DNA-binding domain-containing protein n=1 Tax=Notothenia coriiceps TaxID=8208 RepID=A0A6I9NQC6_9TELE
MAKSEKRGKKRNFNNCEVEILVGEVETRQNILFGGHSIGVTNAKKATEWQHVADAVNFASAQGRTVAEIKKKWSDIKVDAKKRLASHRQSVCATGGGKGAPELTPMDERLAGIIGESLLSGVVTEADGDTDVKVAPDEPDAGSSGVGGQCTEEPPASSVGVSTAPPASSLGVSTAPPALSPGVSTAPPAQPSSSGRVLTDAVLQMQRDTIAAIHKVARELGQLRHV